MNNGEQIVTAMRHPRDSYRAATAAIEAEWVPPPWKDPLHIGTTVWRAEAIRALNRDPKLDWGTGDGAAINMVELYLTEVLPDIDEFQGIFAVDEVGIWWFDGDGDIDDPIWRQRVIPWRYVKGLTLHQAS